MTRVLVVGLDGFDYQLASTWLADLPNLRELMERGAHGPLLSIVQPVTPPAWTSMVTGRNPGWFGFTDFTTRKPGSYAEQRLVHAGMVRADTVFDRADRAGLRTVALSVPVSYPPPRRQGGIVLSCIMAPATCAATARRCCTSSTRSTGSASTWPATCSPAANGT